MKYLAIIATAITLSACAPPEPTPITPDGYDHGGKFDRAPVTSPTPKPNPLRADLLPCPSWSHVEFYKPGHERNCDTENRTPKPRPAPCGSGAECEEQLGPKCDVRCNDEYHQPPMMEAGND